MEKGTFFMHDLLTGMSTDGKRPSFHSSHVIQVMSFTVLQAVFHLLGSSKYLDFLFILNLPRSDA